MRILHLTDLYPPHFQGGYELLCRDVVEYQRTNGIDAVVLTSDWRAPDPAPPPGREPHVHRRLPLFPPNGRYYRPAERIRAVRRGHRSLRDLLRTADAVVTWNPSGIPLTLFTDLEAAAVPVVCMIGDDWLIRRLDRSDSWLMFARNHRAVRLVARLLAIPTDVALPARGFTHVFCSAALRRATADVVGGGLTGSPVVHFGIDHRDFPITGREIPEWRGRVLFVGRADAAKGIDTAIRAMGLLDGSWTLEIVSPPDDGAWDRLRRLAGEIGREDQVSFRSVPRSELAGVYRDADLLVFPSEWDEPFGLVPLEAMSQATPVVASGTGGSREYLRDGTNCVLFQPGDAAALAGAIETVADDDALRRRLSSAGLKTAADFGVDRFAADLTEIVFEVLAAS